jgi:hypothetical protein
VLAGIVHGSEPPVSDIEKTIGLLSLPSTAKELKLKYLAKGGFLDNIKSRKLKILLKWLLTSEYYVHYFNINMEYWAVVDIVDDCCDFMDARDRMNYEVAGGIRRFRDYHKDALYYLMRKYKKEFLGVMCKFEYPKISRRNASAFIKALNAIAKKNRSVSARLNGKMTKEDLSRTISLSRIFESCRGIESLDLVYGLNAGELIDGLSVFYDCRLKQFPDSMHVFDNEYKIEGDLERVARIKDSGLANYKFVDSKMAPAVQVSDVVSGLFKNYFTFIAKSNMAEVVAAASSLEEGQKECLLLMRKLIEKSDEHNPMLLHYIVSQSEYNKHRVIMFEGDPLEEMVRVIGRGA